MLRTFGYNLKIANEAIMQNKLRAVLTSLGIICGVASVIAMLAIGRGAQQEILEKMKLLGTNNIIIKPKLKKDEDATKEENQGKNKEQKRFSPGLTLKDALSIKEIITGVEYVSPEVMMETLAVREGLKRTVNLIGVDSSYFTINQFQIETGANFLKKHTELSEQVCIIGAGIQRKLFPGGSAIGKQIKCGNLWLTVVGVLEERKISEDNIKNLGIRDYNYDIYIPVTTMLLRYRNRNLVTKQNLMPDFSDDDQPKKEENPNQLDRIVVMFVKSETVRKAAEPLNRMFKRRHNDVDDFEIVVPELLLQQEQNTRRIFNIVLGAIASISLIVGGIGIMNIMLASVLERTKEIGIRRAIGARQRDILLQFLSESVSLSLFGGFIGIVFGFILSYAIEGSTGIKTIVTFPSVLISFLVSFSVGLIFGITPARKASLQDPIDLLRYE
ncbi:MAG: putative transport system permease protein [Bacteroidota bacterium]|nr:putative transport system permease protein [Bacteroidota bacterium]